MDAAVSERQLLTILAPRTHLLLTAPVFRTLLRLSAPNLGEAAARITFLTADALFVSWLGSTALAAVAVVYPLLLIIQTFTASGFGAGVSASIGHALGAGDREKACKLAGAALVFALLAAALTTPLLLVFGPTFYRLMGARGEALRLATVYGHALFSGIAFVWLMNLLANAARGSGNMTVPALAIFIGEACHLLCSPALILGWGGLPRLGIAGAAIGALSAYVLGCVVLLAYLLSPQALARINLASIRISAATISPILRIGAPAALGVCIFGGVNFAILWLLGQLGADSIAAFGVASRLDTLLYPLVFAFGSSLITMMATAVGAGDLRRAASVARTGCTISACVGVVFLAVAANGEGWMALFTEVPAISGIGARYLHCQSLMYPIFAAGITAISACYAIGLAWLPLIVNSARFVFVLTGGWLALALFGSVSAVFVVIAASSGFYGIAMLALLRAQLARHEADRRLLGAQAFAER